MPAGPTWRSASTWCPNTAVTNRVSRPLARAWATNRPARWLTELVVAEVVPHEAFDGQHAGRRPVAELLGNAKLFGPIEHVGRPAGVEVQLVAQAQQQFSGLLDGGKIFVGKDLQLPQLGRLAGAVADQSDPAEQLQIAQPAARSLDVRLQEIHRLAEAGAFGLPLADDVADELLRLAADLAAEHFLKLHEQGLVAHQPARFDQRGGDHRVLPGQSGGLLGGPHAMAEHEAGVENVAQQPVGQRRDAVSGRRRVQQHHVDVGIGGHVAAAVAAVGDQDDLRSQVARGGLRQVVACGLEQLPQQRIPQLGRLGA